jgi:hypothetical protein
VAFIVGMGFGFALEQAGFSSTKKLVGLFYGYDFTVLKVFFTAGVTAMIGVLLLGHVGLLDMEVIYVNPTFLPSALVGGAIMGAGFIIGGFCPGTSMCAAAIGKIDGIVFVLGSVLGIFAFNEAYPWLKDFYMAGNRGPVRLDEALGMAPWLFAFLLTTVAVMAFYFTQLIENKVNRRPTTYPRESVTRNALAVLTAFVIIGIVAVTPDREEMIYNRVAEAKRQQKCVFREIDSDKLAYEITRNHYKMNIIDVRPPEEYEKYHLPLAINIPLDSIMNREWWSYFKQDYKTNVFYADNDTTVKKACLLARFIGDSENFILDEPGKAFREKFYELEPPAPDAPKEIQNIYEFRYQAAQKMDDLVEKLKNLNQPVKKEVRQIQGGCS